MGVRVTCGGGKGGTELQWFGRLVKATARRQGVLMIKVKRREKIGSGKVATSIREGVEERSCFCLSYQNAKRGIMP